MVLQRNGLGFAAEKSILEWVVWSVEWCQTLFEVVRAASAGFKGAKFVSSKIDCGEAVFL